ncbi:LysM peptidoglycan-binding domain-containing protein [Pleomorphovibrio marinus]|uniref:LysM peptidoglycan-binding domain-containing protein n=1 Tax=Pleomorphovibrio marinus TaxID=2164132 RepID=UPI000E0A3F23|nr:LysM peptidoglycan-binding domain-containing protein [Pleomorphovibrio marinus]
MKVFLFLWFSVVGLSQVLYAQVPEVPSVIYFADITLKLNEQARREIQADVNALYRSPNYFQIKLDRVNLYMPTVERVLREQGVPTDLKYLVIQESSLISDAVSTSNAVGFWQFKKGTAEEVFLRVDNQIDERKNIVASTRGAALYLKKHQSHLNNWACALVSYQMGLGGARGYFGDKYNGKKTMDIDRNSHWYLKKYLAHKIAFEGKTGMLVSNGDYLHEHPVRGPTTLAALSKSLGVSESHLKEYNKWTTNGQIPGDKTYFVTFIRKDIAPSRPAIASSTETSPTATPDLSGPRARQAQAYPKVSGNVSKATQPGQIKVNDIRAVRASRSGPITQLAIQTGKRERKLRRVNDLNRSDAIIEGNYYYTKRKKAKGKVGEHIVQPGETLWSISQKYGIRLHSLKAKNRLYKDKDLQPGMVLLLQDYRRRNEEIEIVRPSQPKTPVQQTSVPSPPAKSSQQAPATQANSGRTSQSDNSNEQGIEHQVQPGDTLYALSKKYGVSIDQLRSWNGLEESSILKVGQKLKIYQ